MKRRREEETAIERANVSNKEKEQCRNSKGEQNFNPSTGVVQCYVIC
jgi:hypothetical protein